MLQISSQIVDSIRVPSLALYLVLMWSWMCGEIGLDDEIGDSISIGDKVQAL